MFPALHILTFLIVFHGPNAMILGGIKNVYWNFDAVQDLGEVLTNVGLSVLFDILFSLASGLILWKFAKLNTLEKYSQDLKRFWPIIALRLATNSTKVSK